MATSNYEAEIAFMKRKLTCYTVEWQAKKPIEQIVSEPLHPATADDILVEYRKSIGGKITKMKKDFDKILFSVNTPKGVRLAVRITDLRDVFASEIDDDWSGGGKGNKSWVTPEPDPTPGMGMGRR